MAVTENAAICGSKAQLTAEVDGGRGRDTHTASANNGRSTSSSTRYMSHYFYFCFYYFNPTKMPLNKVHYWKYFSDSDAHERKQGSVVILNEWVVWKAWFPLIETN